MAEQFLHGIEHIDIDDGSRAISTVKSSVIGLIVTAPEADAEKFPLNKPVLVAGRRKDAAGLGAAGTLPVAIDGIFDQCGPMIVLIRVAEAETISNIIGGVEDATGANLGVQAFLDARSVVKVRPRILIAPGYSQNLAVATEMVAIAERMKAVSVFDGPNTTNADTISYRENFDSARAYIVDPWVTVWDTEQSKDIVQPASARVAGVIAKMDNDRGFWWSPSIRSLTALPELPGL